jgi:hypothetical protein
MSCIPFDQRALNDPPLPDHLRRLPEALGGHLAAVVIFTVAGVGPYSREAKPC